MEVMIYLLDTHMLIYILRGLKSAKNPKNRQRAQALVERCRLTQSAGDSVGLSVVTVSELEFGARSSGDYETEIHAVRKVLTPFDIYDYDSAACPHHYGRIRHELESRGLTIGAMDLLIAAHSLALAATLVSNNLAHFSRVTGLTAVSWR
jgi:tRNA(fMet)-specific endonuclease VapC